jgi:hypothetical protein
MRKLLLASVFAIASFPGYAVEKVIPDDAWADTPECQALKRSRPSNVPIPDNCEVGLGYGSNPGEADVPEIPPNARVTVTPPPYSGPPPIGWVYGPYTQCANPPQCSMGVVSVAADGLNVRVMPNGPATMALVNGTPLIPVRRQGPWLLVVAGCDLTPTFAWSWTAGVPLNRCWVYYQ